MTTAYDPWVDKRGVGDAVPKLLIRESIWPDPEDAPRFRPAMEAYRAACLGLMRRLVQVLAVAMGEDATFFDRKLDYPIAGIRALYYPPQTASEEEETGLGAHTDVQSEWPYFPFFFYPCVVVIRIDLPVMTMIAQQPYNSQSLQVLNAAGEWISPKLEPGTFVVNLGDMVSRLTNDTFVSTVHRVCNNDQSAVGRYSLPFFFGLSNDELISTRPQFLTPDHPLNENYARPVTGFEHYNLRMRRAHHHHPTADGTTSAALPLGMTKIDGVLVPGL
jgi:isopenicillin N synthase-like dioxygenase